VVLNSITQARVELEVQVLTTGNWPDYQYADLRLPSEVTRELDSFKEFYLSRHSTRKMTWQHSLSHCVIKAHFPRVRATPSVLILLGVLAYWARIPVCRYYAGQEGASSERVSSCSADAVQ